MLPPLFLKDIPTHDKPHIEDDVESIGSDLGVKTELRELKLANDERDRIMYLNKDLPEGPLSSPNKSQASGEWRREFYTRDNSKYERGIVYVIKPARPNERGQGYLEDETLVVVVNANDSEFMKQKLEQAQRVGRIFGRIFCCICVIFGIFICSAVSIPLIYLALRG
jgi:hypothetical protein